MELTYADVMASASTSGWDLDAPEYECDCPGPPPPPVFRIPPPPRPPFLQDVQDCSELTLPEYDNCDLLTVIDAGYRSNPMIPTLTVVVICATLLIAGTMVVFALAWKHKRKVQNFLPCKSSPQNRCDANHGNGVIYEDISSVRSRTGMPPSSIEMLDLKGHHNSYVISHSPMFLCNALRPPGSQYAPPPTRNYHYPPPRQYSQDLYNPVYEELSNGSVGRAESDDESYHRAAGAGSEDEFAEDELSMREGGGNRHLYTRPVDAARTDSDADSRSGFLPQGRRCGQGRRSNHHHDAATLGRNPGARNMSLPAGRRNRPPRQRASDRRPRSLDRRRGGGGGGSGVVVETNRSLWRPSRLPPEPFHEGLLVDAFFQMYPDGGGRCSQEVPVLNHLRRQHQPQELEHCRSGGDNSDSGYSNNTRGSNSSRSRNDTLQTPL